MVRGKRVKGRQPELGPVKDSSEADNRILEVHAMSQGHFNNVVRFIKQGNLGAVQQLREVAKQHAERLSIVPGKAVAGLPDGSDQTDARSIYTWMEKVTPKDRRAKNQIGQMLATIQQRLGG